jgi:DNA-binding MarR family transcriptional regulator
MVETRWLSEAEQRAWRKLAGVVGRLPATLETQLRRDSDLSHFEYWVLAMLSEAPGRRLRMSDLAESAHGSQSRLSHVVGRLERLGWVNRRRSTDDARSLLAALTDEGLRKVVASAPGHVERVRSLVFDGLEPSDVEQLERICGKILDRMTAEER